MRTSSTEGFSNPTGEASHRSKTDTDDDTYADKADPLCACDESSVNAE